MSYAGDSLAKKVVRANLHITAGSMIDALLGRWRGNTWPTSLAIILAGDEGAEVGALVSVQSWPQDRIVVVDRDAAGLEKTRARWPQVQIYHGELKKFCEETRERIGFIHIDLCGHPSVETLETVSICARRLSPGAVVALTFARGHENAQSIMKSPLVRMIRRRSKRRRNAPDNNRTARDVIRAELIRDALDAGKPDVGYAMAEFYVAGYVGHSIPMITTAMQYAPLALRNREWKRNVADIHKRFVCDVARKYSPERFRALLVDMKEVTRAELICALYNIDTATLDSFLKGEANAAHVT